MTGMKVAVDRLDAAIERKEGILVATGNGLLAITELQPVNSRRMGIAQYLAGHPLGPGLVLGTRTER